MDSFINRLKMILILSSQNTIFISFVSIQSRKVDLLLMFIHLYYFDKNIKIIRVLF